VTIWRLVLKEILHHRLHAALTVATVAVGIGCTVGAMTPVGVRDVHSRQLPADPTSQTDPPVVFVALVGVACVGWIAMLGMNNVRTRRDEIGVFRAMGVGGPRILQILLAKALLVGLAGSLLGCLAGYLAARGWGVAGEGVPSDLLAREDILDPIHAAAAVAMGPLVVGGVSLLWAMVALRQDPALVLSEE
jgi:hypothetical protein